MHDTGVGEKKRSFCPSLGQAIQRQKLHSSPWYGCSESLSSGGSSSLEVCFFFTDTGTSCILSIYRLKHQRRISSMWCLTSDIIWPHATLGGEWHTIAVPYPFRGYGTGCETGYGAGDGTLWRVADPLQVEKYIYIYIYIYPLRRGRSQPHPLLLALVAEGRLARGLFCLLCACVLLCQLIVCSYVCVYVCMCIYIYIYYTYCVIVCYSISYFTV